jgi:DNA mismatch endonuclease (patch repair protein)
MGLRFRVHRRDLPGRPDIVLPKYRTVVFVHGCFWHGHKGCARAVLPKSNSEFWTEKIRRNRLRDRHVCAALKKLGWRVVVLWQCQIGNMDAAAVKLGAALKRMGGVRTRVSSRKLVRRSVKSRPV